MSLLDMDSWSIEYEACERLNHSILSQLSQLSQLEIRQHPSRKNNALTSIQVGLKQFNSELQQLKSKLAISAKSRTITFDEIERRQRQVETLETQLLQLQRKFTITNRADRIAELEQPFSSQSPWQSAAENSAPIIESTEVDALKKRQSEILENQNLGLEALSQTISRQRNLASQLGQEVEDQNDILDNLANNMERMDTRVYVETGNIGQVNRRDSTWGYWLVIIALLVSIVIVALV